MSNVGIKFDASELNQALSQMSDLNDKLPSEIVNRKGYFIFGRAAKNMKLVEKQTIQGELGAVPAQALVLLKNGKYSRAKKHITMFFGQGGGKTEGFSLLAAIIQARARKSGKGSPFKGKTREEGAKAMSEEMTKVYNSRQKSRGYFKRCFQLAKEIYRRRPKDSKFSISGIFKREVTEIFEEGDLMSRKGKMADVTLAQKGRPVAMSDFWVKSTSHDTKDALDKYAAPVLQAAVDAEAEETYAHEIEEQYKSAIRSLGIKVS